MFTVCPSPNSGDDTSVVSPQVRSYFYSRTLFNPSLSGPALTYGLRPWSVEWLACQLGALWPIRIVMKNAMKVSFQVWPVGWKPVLSLRSALSAPLLSGFATSKIARSRALPAASVKRRALQSKSHFRPQISMENGNKAIARINALFDETDNALKDGRKYLCGAPPKVCVTSCYRC